MLSRLFCLLELIGMFPIFSVLVIFFSFLRIAQYLIGFIDLLEPLVGLLVIWIQIGMILARQFAVCFFYIFFGGVLVYSKYFVIIYKIHILILSFAKFMNFYFQQ